MITLWASYKTPIEITPFFFLKITESSKFVKFEKLYKLTKNDTMTKRFTFHAKNKPALRTCMQTENQMIVHKALLRYFVLHYSTAKEMSKYISLCASVTKSCIILHWVERKTSSAFITVLWNNYIFLDFFYKIGYNYTFYILLLLFVQQ